ncbi:MAG: extracellular solute-binding protein [Stackebrandtia sp.]
MAFQSARTGLAAAVAGLLLVGAAACNTDSKSADEDGAITLYSGREEALVQPLIDQFTEDTGIEVEVHYGDTAEKATQLLEEGERTPADVFLAQDAGALGALARAEMFAALSHDVLDRVDARYRAVDDTWVGLTGRSRVLVYNPDLVDAEDLPESVLDLAEPAWAEKTAIAPLNGSFQAFVTALRVVEGDDAARDWLQALADNDAPTREKNGPIVADVAAGELEVGLVNHYYIYEKAAEDGVSVDELDAKLHYFTGGDAGALVNVSGVGVLNHAEGDDDVAAFTSYLLETDAQEYFATETYEYPLVDGVEGPENQPALSELDPPDINLNDLDDLETTVSMIQESGLA